MDLLPKNHKQFQEESYWSTFFQDKQTRQGFEWYASYEELEYYLKQSIKDKEQRLLVVGCGNSLLSEKMHKQMGFNKAITSIDFEENVVKKMSNRGVEGVQYQVMDALHMTFEDQSFDYAIDKGTLDALCADRTPETATKVVDYFNEVVRVLNGKGGTYIVVSLLQDFVLDAIVSFFNKGLGNAHPDENIFEVRIQKVEKVAHKVNPDGSTLLPFFITVKRTQIAATEAKLQELRQRMAEIVYFVDLPGSKAEMLPVAGLADRVKKEQIL